MINKISQQEDKLAWVYLVNLTFYLIPLFFGDKPVWQITLALLALIPFVYAYFWAYRSNKHHAYKPILVMIALGIATTPINTGSLSLFTFAGFFIGFFYPLNRALQAFIALAASLFALSYFLEISHYFAIYGTGLVAGIGLFGVAERKRIEAKCKQQQSQDEISQLATMLERERIARDLHDIMGHSLSSISLKAELAEKLLAKGNIAQAQTQLQELNGIARESLSQVRETVSGYKHQGLQASVANLCQTLRDKGLSVSLVGDIPQLEAEVETQVILSVTELCNNIVRHSNASHCQLQFSQDESQHCICIEDDGDSVDITEGNGIKGIRERLNKLGGSLQYRSQPHCQFSLYLPIAGAH
ncbi:sensor histidine kinase [Shewanella waksmanii]|uniref:sensor histidine kinase n=1 Tax=Shewanella waksmanii TaxID=213783 RepID=UPI00048DAF12|nr:sensor histidine kinase [Shewanella waksmanii]